MGKAEQALLLAQQWQLQYLQQQLERQQSLAAWAESQIPRVAFNDTELVITLTLQSWQIGRTHWRQGSGGLDQAFPSSGWEYRESPDWVALYNPDDEQPFGAPVVILSTFSDSCHLRLATDGHNYTGVSFAPLAFDSIKLVLRTASQAWQADA